MKVDGDAVGSAGVAPAALAKLIGLVESGTVSTSAAKEVFDRMYGSNREPDEIVRTEGLSQIGDQDELAEVVAGVLAEQPEAVDRFRGGNAGSLGFLVGQVMRATGGRANPKLVNELLRRALVDD